MKRDIKVNYGVLKSIVSNLNQYKTALENMESTLKNINTKLENENSGDAVNALKSKYNEIKGQVDSCHEEVSDLHEIFQNYITDMTAIIKPKNENNMMRVSRNDIWWNMQTIGGACTNIQATRSNAAVYITYPNPFAEEDEKAAERRNGQKVDSMHNDIINYGKKLISDFNDMNSIYNKKVIPYENMDDTYKTKAKSVYSKYTSFLENLKTGLFTIGVGAIDLVKGVASSFIGLVKGVFDLVKGAVIYAGAGIGIACTKISGDAPDCLKYCQGKAKEYNRVISAIIHDPFIVIEGLSQGINDAYEEKGICYVTGYAIGEIAQVILIKKAGEKLKSVKGADNAADGVKTTESATDVEKLVKTSEELIKESTCTKDDFIKYLQSCDDYFKTNYADEFARTGKWPEEIQIPKSPDVLNPNGGIDWAQVPNSGYVLDDAGNAIKELYSPRKGEIIDRFGPSDGTFTSPVKNGKVYPYDMRSLPYVEDVSKYHQYQFTDDLSNLSKYIKNCKDPELVKDIDSFMKYKKIKSYDDLVCYKGKIAKGFGAKGGGIQYQLPLPVDILEDLGIIKKIK
ncbi:MAG: DUF4237 domain-containing protein [Clostridium sp.]|nr:DUF4237 domain-containing protein [Clostridium sp.]